ncbi:hypothetical protein EON63_17305 [archaeon]|nr:MAG: hypothetical protein EON63_17305 [archaeon]
MHHTYTMHPTSCTIYYLPILEAYTNPSSLGSSIWYIFLASLSVRGMLTLLTSEMNSRKDMVSFMSLKTRGCRSMQVLSLRWRIWGGVWGND